MLSALGAAVLAGSVVTAMPAAASVGGPSCGDTITQDVVLTHDLYCSGDGLVIGRSGLSVDLGGHSLHGSGGGSGIEARGRTVDVSNGEITGFARGIWDPIYDYNHVTEGSRLSGVRLIGNGTGLLAESATPLHIVSSVFQDNSVGLYVAISTAEVRDTTFARNSVAIDLDDEEANLSNDVFFADEVAVRSYHTGLRVLDSHFAQGGIGIQSTKNVGLWNLFEGNTFVGLGLGASYTGDSGNVRVAGNSFVNNGASGLVLDHPAFPAPTIVTGNRFVHNGFAPGSYTSSTGQPLRAGLWARNVAEIAGNIAINNAGYGIEAYDSVDGGGNVARNNRAGTTQCLGVVCSTRGGGISSGR